MKIGQLPLKIFLMIIATDLLDTGAQLFMKKGLGHDDFTTLSAFAASLFRWNHPDIFLFWLGVAICVFNFFLWMSVLAKVDLSIALPVASVSYILIPLAAIAFLHEQVGWLRWLGLAFIVFGIYWISQSKSLEKEKNA